MSKTLQMSIFTNLRLARATYTPAHSKNGVDVSARLAISAFMNENRRGQSEDKSKAISLTAWGPAADILAWTLSPGKEFTAFCDLNVFDAPVYHNNQPLSLDGVAIMRKCYGYTIRRFDLGNDSFNHISRELQAGTRGPQFWVKGSQDALNFKALLDSRIAAAKAGYNPQVNGDTWGFCKVEMPRYQYGAYVGKGNTQTVTPAANVGAAPTAETVAATFTGNAVAPGTAVPPAQSFVMPQAGSAPSGV